MFAFLYFFEITTLLSVFAAGHRNFFWETAGNKTADRLYRRLTNCHLTPALSFLLASNGLAAVAAWHSGDPHYAISYILSLVLTHIWKKLAEAIE